MTEFPVVAQGDADLSNFIASFAAGTATLSTFAGAAVAATTAGAALAAVALIPAIEAAAKFQEEIVKLNTLVGISEELMSDFEESILDLAPALGTAPDELARAMFAITSGGERSAKAVDLLTQSAKAARLGLGDTAVIARVGTAALQAFANQGLTASEAIDIMVGTVREGNLVAEELPNAFGRVIGIAGQMGVTFEEVGTFMATFTRLGVSSEIAATSLRATLFALLNPGKEARDTFDELGLSVETMQRKIREDGLTDAMLQLLAATEGNLDILSDIIPNIRAMSGVLGVYAAQAEQVVVIQENMNNIFGVTDAGFERIQGTAAQSAAELGSSIKTMAVGVGRFFLPATKVMIDSLTLVVNALNRTGQAALNFSDRIGEDFDTLMDFINQVKQTDASDLEVSLGAFRGTAESSTTRQLQQTLELVAAQRELVGQRQIDQVGDANANNQRMRMLNGQEDILNDILSRRTDILPKVIEGIRVVVGQTEAQVAATDKLIAKMETQLLQEQGLERQILLNTIGELDVTAAQRERLLSLFDLIEAEELAEEVEKARVKQAKVNIDALNRLSDANDRLFARAQRRAEKDRRTESERDAALETEIMVARIEDALDRKARLVEDVSRVVTNSFSDIIRGTKDTAEAFEDMVTRILAEFARLKVEQALVGFLSNLLIPIPGSPSRFPDPVIDPTAGLNALPGITGPGAISPSVSLAPTTIVQQSITFSPNLIDGRSGQRFIQEHGGEITNIIGRAAQQSSVFANAVRGS